MGIEVKLEVFEGPLDLLLHLIEKNKVNIYDIPIVEITAQYLAYVQAMQEENLDIVSDFLVMAATLLDIKCRMLLPREVNEEGEEEDPRSELVERLLEYKMYKYASLDLRDRQMEAARALYKPPTIPPEVASYEQPVDVEALLSDITLSRLQTVFDFVMKRREDKVDPVRSRFGQIRKEPVKVEDKIQAVMEYGLAHRVFLFRELLEKQRSRMEIVVTFLAVLELLKIGRLQAWQEQLFDDIRLELVDDTPVVFDEEMRQAAGG
ncbi:MAG: segregation/condensation protein A [Lachnospiraceae bacterium]|jgi:segregation and condensation protein A|nr:segregation/condensation protein A [Lachnospiraceae bacterium]